MKTSQIGINLIKQFEGCRLQAYKPVPTEKYYTIGYGHYGPDVAPGSIISQAQADAYLALDLQKFENAVNALGLKLNQNQFDALVSFAYNCGAGNLKKLVSGRTLPQIADAMLSYNKGGGKVLAGLVRRREAERTLFLSGMNQGESSSTTLEKADIPVNGNPYKEPTKNVRLNTKGNDARWLQWALNNYSLKKGTPYGLHIDGIAGLKTISALADFQSKHDLRADGICGPKTIKALLS